jgi:Uma2 family endonuclease
MENKEAPTMPDLVPLEVAAQLPDHKQLPDTDGAIVQNFQEHPQSVLLTDTITPQLRRIRPDGQWAIGQDSGIYYEFTDPPLQGCRAPDWYALLGVPPLLDGEPRRSYVLWRERVRPTILLEFVSGDGTEERDRTPRTGKFWIYEQMVQATYYGIYEVDPGRVEMYHLEGGRYVRMEPNARGRYEIPELGVELGIWQGEFQAMDLPWMRFWDMQGRMLPTGHELAEQEHHRAEEERKRATLAEERAAEERKRATQAEERAGKAEELAEQQRKKLERLAAQLKALGIDPDQLPDASL